MMISRLRMAKHVLDATTGKLVPVSVLQGYCPALPHFVPPDIDMVVLAI